MITPIKITQRLLACILLFTTAALHAQAQPSFTIIPLTATDFNLAGDEVVTIQYNVTNQSVVTRTLTMTPITGVTQITTGTNVCTQPFTLATKQSCILTLSIDGRNAPAHIMTSPEVCKTNNHGTSDPFLCSRTSFSNRLNITKVPENMGGLSVSPSILTLTASGASGNLTITNLSSVLTARNVVAHLGTLEAHITQDATQCVTVLPGASCTLTFTPDASSITLMSFPIKGDNTQVVGAAIQVISPTTAAITVTRSPLILDVNSTGMLTVTNNSTTITATAVMADITGALADAGVTQDSSNCNSIAPGASCDLNFASVNIPVAVNQVPVTGTNTSITIGAIGVNGPPEQTIAITAGSPLTLTTSNANTGTMIISNTSGAEIAAGVTAHFESTALNGYVTSDTCPAIPVGGTCTLTFTAGTTVVNPTEFPIYGEETTSAVGIITIITPYAYLTSSTSNEIYQCVISAGNGSLIGCTKQSLSTLNAPRGIVINPSRTLIYIANNGDNSVTQCAFNEANGTISACQSASANGLNGPIGIRLNPAGTFAYVTNNNNTVSLCAINAITGSFDTSCINSGATDLDLPRDIVINSSNSYAYIANFNNKMVECVVNNTGTLSACSATSVSPGIQFNGLAINPNDRLLYVSDFNVGNLFQCVISGGSLESCTIGFTGTPKPLFRSAGVAINAARTLLYVANTDGNTPYAQCILHPNESISHCTNLTQSPKGTWGVAILD